MYDTTAYAMMLKAGGGGQPFFKPLAEESYSQMLKRKEYEAKLIERADKELTEKKGEYFKKSLILIKLAKDKFDIDGLTSAEITKILQDHLRVPAIYQPNISTALGARGTSKYVLKQATKSKKVFIYKLTKLGEDFTNNTNLQQKKK